ncbi:hypothetical protein C5O27_11880 [Gordonia alkanivorans]|nr:hypothetical protein C5O27_11880 [Gordonia alkanivorans]
MHDNTSEPEQPAVAPEDSTATETDTPTTEGTEPEVESPEPQSKREARYRVQLRETEAERDSLAGLLETLQRTEAERLAADVIHKPDALWAADINLTDLLDDTGLVSPDKVKAAAHAAKEKLGLELGAGERKKRGPVVPREGTGADRSTHNAWKDAFNK